MSKSGSGALVGWALSPKPVDYRTALSLMTERVDKIAAGQACELVWLLEHSALYTAGTSARTEDLLSARLPVYETGRGGQYTYHGPGQRIAYLMLDVRKRYGGDIRAFVTDLEGWLISALARLGVTAERRTGRVGLWVPQRDESGTETESKIAALGIRVSRGVSSHGVSINVAPDLTHYSGIVPCGLKDYGVTSLRALGNPAAMADLDRALRQAFAETFSPVVDEDVTPVS